MQVFSEAHYKAANQGGQTAFRSRLRHFKSRLSQSGLSIKFTLNGKESYRINQQEMSLQPGSFIVVDQGQYIECMLDSPTVVDAVCLYLDPQSLLDAFLQQQHLIECQQAWWNDNGLVYTTKFLQTNDILSKIIKDIQAAPEDFFKSQTAFDQIIQAFATQQIQLRNACDRIEASQSSTKIELWKRVHSVDFQMQQLLQKDLRLDDLARKAHLSKFHFSRVYANVFGRSPKKQLNNYRITHAKSLLRQSIPIEDIAYACGFNDRQTFARAFRRHENLTPTAYRKQVL